MYHEIKQTGDTTPNITIDDYVSNCDLIGGDLDFGGLLKSICGERSNIYINETATNFMILLSSIGEYCVYVANDANTLREKICTHAHVYNALITMEWNGL